MPSTAYPEGEIQWAYVYYDKLYEFNRRNTIANVKDAEYLGTINHNDNKTMPSENLDSSQVEEGLKVYKMNDCLYVQDPLYDNYYSVFVVKAEE